ncbi:MAG: hypothetical protein QMC95_15250 [Desulfitobacteriaceae bacterium]|nr:hypothetical protein [Desulfitobacteriaceae bacterium]MDI6915548.1 hypothetical protein [Desulfitobacteriaceae bacterium]
MTSAEKRRVQYKKLVVDIKDDLNSIQNLVKDIEEVAKALENNKGPLRGSDLMACAGYLHHYFTGVESIFERISRAFDGSQPPGGDYHRELLHSMTVTIPEIRPRIISRDIAEELDEYRRFRHMFRHAYGSELRWRKMEPLAKGVASLTETLVEQISEFMHFVETLSDSLVL